MGDNLKQKLAKSIELADKVTSTPNEQISFKQECGELKYKTKKICALLQQAATTSSELYMQRPMQQILKKTEHVLNKTLSLVLKCRTDTIRKRVFNIIPKATFHRTSSQLENTIGNVSWLLYISRCNEDHDSENHILPSIILNDPMVTLIWELIASLCTGSQEYRSDSAASLVSLAHRSNHYGKMIIEEGGVGPLLKLVDEGNTEGQKQEPYLSSKPETPLSYSSPAHLCGRGS
ncbi:putative armadillo-like helical protein [Medicago truncatula]|uniref:Armadillo repeat only 1 protein n=1 Tax=Medicago truncatula TaxID=3880 RepID=A0A072THN6_MEDTR|nr:armadillo repeat only 1 protein [Medicago truncatula]RHN45283.1 putative armadillo-like helical protein [Medicago truncatula]